MKLSALIEACQNLMSQQGDTDEVWFADDAVIRTVRGVEQFSSGTILLWGDGRP